jgi:hypothetical protein
MRDKLPGVAVDTQLMPLDKMLEVSNIALAAKSDSIDIIYILLHGRSVLADLPAGPNLGVVPPAILLQRPQLAGR